MRRSNLVSALVLAITIFSSCSKSDPAAINPENNQDSNAQDDVAAEPQNAPDEELESEDDKSPEVTKSPKTRREIINQLERAVYTVQVLSDSDDIISTGTGFMVAKNGVLATCAHVIHNASKIRIVSLTGGTYEAIGTLNVDDENDIALLSIRGNNLDYIETTESIQGARGDSVFVFGSPKGVEGILSEGIVSSFPEGANEFQFTAPVSPGSSGSPIVSDRGELLGIAKSVIIDSQNLNYASSSSLLTGLLDNQELVEFSTSQDISGDPDDDGGVSDTENILARLSDFTEKSLQNRRSFGQFTTDSQTPPNYDRTAFLGLSDRQILAAIGDEDIIYNGRTYSRARVTNFRNGFATVRHSTGMFRLPLSELNQMPDTWHNPLQEVHFRAHQATAEASDAARRELKRLVGEFRRTTRISMIRHLTEDDLQREEMEYHSNIFNAIFDIMERCDDPALLSDFVDIIKQPEISWMETFELVVERLEQWQREHGES